MPPMPFVPAPSTCLVRLFGEYYGDTIVNDINIKKIATAYSDADMLDIMDRVNNWWAGDILPLLNEHYLFQGSQIRDQSVPAGRYFDLPISGSAPGGITGNGSPGNVTFRMFFKGALAPRGGRYGNSVSGLTQSNVIGNTINATWAGNVHAAYNLLGPIINTGAVYFWANVSKITGGAARTTAYVDPILMTSYNTKVHTMGKRVNGK